jgi:molybdopterin/thiamine biosynthesis adenylyltransferase
MFDRNIRAFGEGVQRVLASLRVGVIGCGGTGSAVIEQLVRLGVRTFTLFDPDALSATNVTRVYGSTPADVGRLKVDVLGDHIERIAPGAVVERLPQPITVEVIARQLATCDILFGCTDDNAGRLVLSRASTYLMTPVIDCGVLLSSDSDGALVGIDGRVTVLVPGHACLICRGRIDLQRASAEMLTPEERIKREDEGYAPALGRTEPAVVSFTTGVATTVVNELLERLVGFGTEPRPSEVLVRFHERELSSNIALPREKHYCDPKADKLGSGISSPLFEIAWSS